MEIFLDEKDQIMKDIEAIIVDTEYEWFYNKTGGKNEIGRFKLLRLIGNIE